MSETQAQELPGDRPNDATESISMTKSAPPTGAVTPQGAPGSCPTCSAAQASGPINPLPNVYVIGHIEPRYPSLSVEKELRQATARASNATVNLTDQQATLEVLLQNKYLIREMCWVLLVQGIETYILVPRDPTDYQLLLDAYRASPNPGDLDAVIGVRGPTASPTMCNGLIVPILIFDQIYSFDRQSLLDAIPKPPDADAGQFTAAAGAMLDQVIGQSDNAGATDEHRALNYLALRYHQIYTTAANAFASNASFTSISVLPSPLSATRNVVDVVFAFTNRATDVVSKSFVRVDVTDKFPFLVTKMSPYYDR
jgi:hypothetical protein